MITKLSIAYFANLKYKMAVKSLHRVLPAFFGTILEYYDYALYGFCVSLIAPLFFIDTDPTVALLKTFGIFFAGSLAKPMGALIFGYIGDKYGRCVSLKISMLGIALPTIGIGLMPTYSSIGWLAPCGLLICRILQGMFTAGESDGVRIYLYESLGKSYPCLTNSLIGVACMIGIYFASLAASVVIAYPTHIWAWRVPFVIGGALGLFVFWSRFYLIETVEFSDCLKTRKQTDLLSFTEIIVKNKRLILATILLCGSVGGGYHFYLVFLGNYLVKLKMIDLQTIAHYIPKALLVYIVLAPISGILADRFGADKILNLSVKALLIAAIVNAVLIHQGILFPWVVWLTAGILSFFQAPGFVVLFEKFKVDERYRSIGLGHAMGSMLFSGSTPFISLWLWHNTGMVIAPFIYFIALILMGYGALFILRFPANSTHKNHTNAQPLI